MSKSWSPSAVRRIDIAERVVSASTTILLFLSWIDERWFPAFLGSAILAILGACLLARARRSIDQLPGVGENGREDTLAPGASDRKALSDGESTECAPRDG